MPKTWNVIIIQTVFDLMKFNVHCSALIAAAAALSLSALLTTSCTTQGGTGHNTLSAQEKADGWRLLWDGKTTQGWHMPKSEAFPTKSWSLDNGEDRKSVV